MQVLSGESYELFKDALRTKATREAYTKCLDTFCSFVKMDTDSLVSLGKSDPDKATKLVADYIRLLKWRAENNQISSGTVYSYYAPIKLLFTMNDVDLRWKRLQRMLPEYKKFGTDRGYNVEEVRTMLKFCDVREKVAVLLLPSSGVRVGAVPLMDFKHLTPIVIDGKVVCCKIIVYPGAKEQYTTFASAEFWNATEEYKKYREEHGEKITGDSPLIRQKNMLPKVRRVGDGTLEQMVLRCITEAGLRKNGTRKRYDVKTNHGFRKFFNGMCIKAKVNHLHRKLLMGHTVGIEHSYYKPTDDELMTEYVKVLPLVTFNDAELLQKELKDLKEKLESQINLNLNGVDIDALRNMIDMFKKNSAETIVKLSPGILQKPEGPSTKKSA